MATSYTCKNFVLVFSMWVLFSFIIEENADWFLFMSQRMRWSYERTRRAVVLYNVTKKLPNFQRVTRRCMRAKWQDQMQNSWQLKWQNWRQWTIYQAIEGYRMSERILFPIPFLLQKLPFELVSLQHWKNMSGMSN